MKGFRGLELIRHDPPDHTRVRGMLHRYFTPKLMEEWRLFIREAVGQILDQGVKDGRIDIYKDLGEVLPLRIILHLLGLPQKDGAFILEQASKHMSDDTSASPHRMRVSQDGIEEMTKYLTPFIEERIKRPTGDLLSLLAVGEGANLCTREEALANAMLLVDAGFETTIKLLCNGTLALLKNPDQMTLLRNDPSLAPKVTEESLRYDPPVPALGRFVAQDMTIGGKKIRQGERLIWSVLAANRDPRVFPNPDAFDIMRSPNHHVTFGSGVHYCLGQYLARIEGQEVFIALSQRYPKMRLETDAVGYSTGRRTRAVKSLPVRVN